MQNFTPTRCTILTVILFFFVSNSMIAQRKDFKLFSAGVTFGYNASQIDGDKQLGFDKGGIIGGIKGVINFNERTALSIDILYSQLGSKPAPRDIGRISTNPFPVTVDLDYVEVPILINRLFALNKVGEYSLQFQGGFGFSRLLKSDVKANFRSGPGVIKELEDDFSSFDVRTKLGLAFFPVKQFSVGGVLSVSLIKLADPSDIDFPEANDLRLYNLSWQLTYYIK